MAAATDRSPEMVKLVYFMHEYARPGKKGRSKPPEEFGETSWRGAYDHFFARLGDGRTFETFKGSAEGLRNGNIKQHKEDDIPLSPKY